MHLRLLAMLATLAACNSGKVPLDTAAVGEDTAADSGSETADTADTIETADTADTADTSDTAEDCIPSDEICDGSDNDCDGETDEDLLVVVYTDADGDGFGDAASPLEVCAPEEGTSLDATDCDDSVATAYPGSTETELPGDGIDTDCDGQDICTDLDCDGLPDLILTGYLLASDYEVSNEIYAQRDGWTSSSELSLGGIEGALVADLNGDGYPDLALARYYDGTTRDLASFVFWGSADGFVESTELSTVGAMDVLAQDLDGDGYTDLVFSNYRSDESWQIDSSVYWGSSRGYDDDSRTDLPTRGARTALAEDLDEDGYTDLVFCNLQEEGGSTETTSSVYWGSSSGFDADEVTDLPTLGCRDVAAADLDGDGWTDLVFANYYDAAEEAFQIDSTVYWGSGHGYDADDALALPTVGAIDVEVADADADGDLDLVFAGNSGGEAEGETRVFWSASGSLSDDAYDSFETEGAVDALVQDLDGDGYPELLLSRVYDGSSYELDSYLWWGSAEGWSDDERLSLPTVGGQELAVGDLDEDGLIDLCFSSYTGSTGPTPEPEIFWGQSGGDHGVTWASDDRRVLDGASSRTPPLLVP